MAAKEVRFSDDLQTFDPDEYVKALFQEFTAIMENDIVATKAEIAEDKREALEDSRERREDRRERMEKRRRN